MKSMITSINEKGQGLVEALDGVEKFCNKKNYTGKENLHTRLLAEELIGMVKGIISNDASGDAKFDADFWLEGTGKQCELHVTVKANMDNKKKKKLLSVSSTGENIAAKGIMGKIRQVVEDYLLSYEEIDNEYGGLGHTAIIQSGMVGFSGAMMMQSWSLQSYIETVQSKEEENREAWDELEKSVIASLADDVVVGVQNNRVEIIVKKNYARE